MERLRQFTASHDAFAPGPRLLARRVLLIAGSRGNSIALRRADAFARLLDAELHVLHVLPAPTALRGLFRALRVSEQAHRHEHEEILACLRESRAFFQQVLGRTPPESSVHVEMGDFLGAAVAHASSLGAMLAIVSADHKHLGDRITTLARVLATPVLVARAPGAREMIIAATDLEDARYPVLHEASELARQLAQQVVAVHNLAPLLELGIHASWPVAILSDASGLQARKRKLANATAQLAAVSQTVISQDSSTVDAILQQARSRSADLVIVGTRPRSRFDRFVRGSVASQVVDRSRRSVLVVPMDGSSGDVARV